MDIFKQYKILNKSFEKKLVFRVGAEDGFFSEYNNMILAIHYCLVNKIKFVLSSKNANFATTKKGWTDFFLPFCNEYKFPFLSLYNKRFNKPIFRNNRHKFIYKGYTSLKQIDYFTHDLMLKIRDQDLIIKYSVPELELNGPLIENCSKIHNMIWKYNEYTQNEIITLKLNQSFGDAFYGMHIRAGDKLTEHNLFEIKNYMKQIGGDKTIKNIFVLTDDYQQILLLRKSYPDYIFKTLCNESETGYIHSEFQQKTKMNRRMELIKLFASMDIMENAEKFIGTFTSNPGMNMGFRMSQKKIIGIDYEEWSIW